MIHCPKCGAGMPVRHIGGKLDSQIADAMQVAYRNRECRACGTVLHTTELRTAELGELRRQAYLWQRHEAADNNRKAPSP
jgi:ribosomal protein S27AE